MNFIEELEWRGMIHDIMPGTQEQLKKEMTTAYVGYDPTCDSLHIGNLATIMMLKHFQLAGHKPIALVGGATGMVGDPSGRSEERNLLDEKTLRENQEGIKKELLKFLDFDPNLKNGAELVNNYDWTKEFSFLSFLREVGKHLTVNYMMAKDSVKKRLETGLSFTEFSYQLLQAYDFLHLYRDYGCTLQVGGSDQWGNVTAGIDLIRRIEQGQAYGMTFPLLADAGGEKFGKTAAGAVWLDAGRTSVWDFYQYWVRTDDRDVIRYLKLFTFLPLEEIAGLERQVADQPEKRAAQQVLAREVTTIAHGAGQAEAMDRGARMLYGQEVRDLTDEQIKLLLADAPMHQVSRDRLSHGIPIVELLVEAGMVPSKSEARRRLKGGGIYLNNAVVDESRVVDAAALASASSIVLRSGKKNYCLIQVV